MFWFVPYISDPVWNFTYVAYSLTSSICLFVEIVKEYWEVK